MKTKLLTICLLLFTSQVFAGIVDDNIVKLKKTNACVGCDLRGANLSYADLTKANLHSANLSYADLSYADLSHADLKYANLSYANLSYADLPDAYLSYADFSHADLKYADLKYADLKYADLTDANLTDANLTNADLSYADLTEAKLTKANLHRANLSNAKLTNANQNKVKLSDAKPYIKELPNERSVEEDVFPTNGVWKHSWSSINNDGGGYDLMVIFKEDKKYKSISIYSMWNRWSSAKGKVSWKWSPIEYKENKSLENLLIALNLKKQYFDGYESRLGMQVLSPIVQCSADPLTYGQKKKKSTISCGNPPAIDSDPYNFNAYERFGDYDHKKLIQCVNKNKDEALNIEQTKFNQPVKPEFLKCFEQ